MPNGLLVHGHRRHFSVDDLTRRWVGGIGLAAAVGLGYFLAVAFSVRLILDPEGVARVLARGWSFLRSSDRS